MNNIVLVNKLIAFCIEQVAKGNDFWFSYSGHVDTISIRGIEGKWSLGVYVIKEYTCKVSELTPEKVNSWIDNFRFQLSQPLS